MTRVERAVGNGIRRLASQHLGQSNDEGIDGSIKQDPLGLNLILVQAKRYAADNIIDRARQDELMIYIVQFRSTARAQMAEMPLSPTAGASMSDPRRFTTPPTATLRRLATQTGGGHFQLNQYDDVNATFTQVMQELHYQYVLGFTPQRLDGKVHDLRVRLQKPDPDTEVRARRNYRAPLP